ncbi:MAG: RNA-binding domain-containing protein [Candidatus Hodarchaeota archaeon]
MVSIGRIQVRAYSRSTEVLDRVRIAILNLFPDDVREEIKFTESKAEGHGYAGMVVLSSSQEGKDCERSFLGILERLSEEDKLTLEATLSQRLDDQCQLFLRIDKQASYLSSIQLAQGQDVLRIKVQLKQFPSCNRADAEKFLSEHLHATGGAD